MRRHAVNSTGDETAAILQIAGRVPQLGATSCVDAIDRLSGLLTADQKRADKQKLINAQVINIHVKGDSATADIQGGTQTAQFERVGGRWLISGGISL